MNSFKDLSVNGGESEDKTWLKFSVVETCLTHQLISHTNVFDNGAQGVSRNNEYIQFYLRLDYNGRNWENMMRLDYILTSRVAIKSKTNKTRFCR
jgi:hypothetical protein